MTPSRSKKLEITIFVAALAALIAIWAVNGYEDTWLYTMLILISLPPSWIYFSRKNKDK